MEYITPASEIEKDQVAKLMERMGIFEKQHPWFIKARRLSGEAVVQYGTSERIQANKGEFVLKKNLAEYVTFVLINFFNFATFISRYRVLTSQDFVNYQKDSNYNNEVLHIKWLVF